MAARRRRFRRFRRKSRYQWFPTIGTAGLDDEFEFDDYSGRTFTVPVAANQLTSNTIIAPVTIDTQFDTADSVIGDRRGLQDELGQSWFLKRLVGQLFLEKQYNSANEEFAALAVSAGFFVARCDDNDTTPLSPSAQQPIGADILGRATANYGPIRSANISEPWIWRRTWILGRGMQPPSTFLGNINTGSLAFGANFPNTTAAYGTDHTNGYIDAKTARRIRKEERLFFVVQAKVASLEIGSVPTSAAATNVVGYLDLRILGQLRRNSKRSVF